MSFSCAACTNRDTSVVHMRIWRTVSIWSSSASAKWTYRLVELWVLPSQNDVRIVVWAAVRESCRVLGYGQNLLIRVQFEQDSRPNMWVNHHFSNVLVAFSAPFSLWPPRSEFAVAVEYVPNKTWIKRGEDGGLHPLPAAMLHHLVLNHRFRLILADEKDKELGTRREFI